MMKRTLINAGLVAAALHCLTPAWAADDGHSPAKAEAKGKEEGKAKAKDEPKGKEQVAKVKEEPKAKEEPKGKEESKGKEEGKAKDEPKPKSASKSREEGKGKDEATPDGKRTLTLEQLQEAIRGMQRKDTLKLRAAADARKSPGHAAHAATPASAGAVRRVAHAEGASPAGSGAATGHGAPAAPAGSSRDYIKARAVALANRNAHPTLAMASPTAAAAGHGTAPGAAPGAPGHAHGHWSYEGETGPNAWARLNPEFGTCAAGQRQSPIHIEEDSTLQGPAEPLQLRYNPSAGSVVNNGHTIQVDVSGTNVLTIRGTDYELVQFHAHTPAEERINQKGFAMVMHLVHRASDGRLAVIAVLLDPGPANPLIQKVWTYMPLDSNDRVGLPSESINLNDLLPQDRRYYQFIGSLTTPPCTEGVLWIVLKQPMTLSREQLRMFARIFPMNARPVQPLNGRVVRSAD